MQDQDHGANGGAAEAINRFFDELAAVRMPHGIAWGHQTQVSELRAKALQAIGTEYLSEELVGYLSGLAVSGALTADQVSHFSRHLRTLKQHGWL
ncbi:hypothetical protein [Pseudomonas massiliensis]|uniref:hypothetical protein n=1 Tax=Pseudomonas massiliensis TaxID=522492 RepID=UPI00058D9229|nr:hypothetical protein [Pseudomonas massiliensis]